MYKEEKADRTKNLAKRKMSEEIVRCQNFHTVELPSLLKKNNDYEERKKVKKLQNKAESLLSLGRVEYGIKDLLWKKCTFQIKVKWYFEMLIDENDYKSMNK